MLFQQNVDKFPICYNLLWILLNECHWVTKAAIFTLRNLLILEGCSLYISWTGRLCSWKALCCTSRHCCLTLLPRAFFFLHWSAVHLLEELTLGSSLMFHFAKGLLKEIFSCVEQRGDRSSKWFWHDGSAEKASVIVARNIASVLWGLECVWCSGNCLCLKLCLCFFYSHFGSS